MKRYTTIEIKVPAVSVLTFLRERFPELPDDTVIDQATLYSQRGEMAVKVHCNFEPEPDENRQDSVD